MTAPDFLTRLWRGLPSRWRRTLQRMAWTFAETFTGLIAVDQILQLDLDTVETAAASAAAGALVVFKDAAARELKRLRPSNSNDPPPDTSGWVDPPDNDGDDA